MKRNIYSALIVLVFALIFLGCGGPTKLATTALIVPDFDFSPPSPAAPGSAGIKIGLIDPVYSGNFLFSNQAPFKQFRKNMGSDFEEILTARGYFLKGPYEVYDLMTYADKNECELGLDIEIDLDITQTTGGWTRFQPVYYQGGIVGGNYATYAGTLNLSGKITVSIIETFTRQKLLIKSVPVPQEDIMVKAEADFVFGTTGLPIRDPGVHNPIANALSSLYKTTMKRGWDLLAKEDLEHLQKQVPEIREKAGFIKR
ncbi:MAG: hypothetical protein WC209_06965 [Ignavibacteriaceae bacterium]|jgi:hypothetical protein